MKTMKNLLIAVLTLTMVLSMGLNAFAATTGSITITDPEANSTYDIYLMFTLESYDSVNGNYSYKITADWEEFVTTGAGSTYFEMSAAGFVTVKSGVSMTDDDKAALALEALDYAQVKGLTPVATLDSITKTANNLQLGYYLVDSSLGTICVLTTTAPAATINEKNGLPTLVKEVLIDNDKSGDFSEGDVWGIQNVEKIGDPVFFKTVVTAKEGAVGYELHDRMDEGLTLDETSIEVKVGDVALVKDTDYTIDFNVACSATETCTYVITFAQTYLDTITKDTEITVTYGAVVNENAKVAPDPNRNLAKLRYSNSQTEWVRTETRTSYFDLVKTKNDNTILAGAKFKLYDAEVGGNEIPLVKYHTINYRVATSQEAAAEGFVSETINAGTVKIVGLENDTYWLEEIEAPAGYNLHQGRIKVDLTKNVLSATWAGDGSGKYISGGVQVINETGAMLPGTGGIGTTIFYIVGGILVIGAFVLLVSKKRLAENK